MVMVTMRPVVVAVALALLCFPKGIQVISSFNPSMASIVDWVESSGSGGLSVLARGNLPIWETGVPLTAKELLAAIQDRAGHEQIPNNLVIVSLISPSQSDEMEAWEKQTTMEDITVVEAIDQDVTVTPLLLNVPLAQTWFPHPDSFRLLSLERTINWWRDTLGLGADVTSLARWVRRVMEHEPTTVYIHCMRGKDRTGLLAAAYSMLYKGESLQSVTDTNTRIAQRELHTSENNIIGWVAEQVGATSLESTAT